MSSSLSAVETGVPSLIDGFYAVVALVLVCGLLALFMWLLRRGALTLGGARRTNMTVEGALPLGERRSLVVVVVEGRRLLLGVTPAQVSLVTELANSASFPDALQRRMAGEPEPRT